MSAIVGPIPAYQNTPIRPEWYKPNVFVINNITLGQTTLVETTTAQNYVIGQLVRLIIPQEYGCVQLNNVSGLVIDIPADNQVVVKIDSSRNVNNFISASNTSNRPQIKPVGDYNSGAINANGRITKTFIPGSFQNISPGIGVQP